MFYRYFCRNKKPSDMIIFSDVLRVVDYEEPIDSGNGKMMYGYVDYARQLTPGEINLNGLDPAPINPISD